jgi:hypothetical protein
MELPENLPKQLQLALSVLSGRVTELTPQQYDLLSGDGRVSTDIRWIAEEVVYEVFMHLLTQVHQEETTIDLAEVAVKLLHRIQDNGGSLHRDAVGLPEELIGQLQKEGVVRRTVRGLIWGPNARRAIAQLEEEKKQS